MLDNVKCEVKTAAELDSKIQEILSLDHQGRGNEIAGTLHIQYSDEDVKNARLVHVLEERGVAIVWKKK